MWETESNLKRVEIERRAFEMNAEAGRWFEREVEEANPEPSERELGIAERVFEEMAMIRATLGAFLIR
jgi:hypothetical protein